MTHYTRSLHSDKVLCQRTTVEIGRLDDDFSVNLGTITCPKCIEELENIVRRLKNGNS